MQARSAQRKRGTAQPQDAQRKRGTAHSLKK